VPKSLRDRNGRGVSARSGRWRAGCLSGLLTGWRNKVQSTMTVGDNHTAPEIRALRLELMSQWITNHAEHCGVTVPPWPHRGGCQWPLPSTLSALPSDEVRLLFLEVSGESFGLRL
jgi:hypothetical protein